MRIGVMQPYFFPYIGYFALLNYVDEFIILEDVQFIRHGWIERNRLVKPDGKPFYIKVPLQKHSRDTQIRDVVIRNNENWQQKILAQLAMYKRAKNFQVVRTMLEELFTVSYESITELNIKALEMVCDYLSVSTPIFNYSKLNYTIDSPQKPDEWALNICKAHGASTYTNPIGGMSFFHRNKYVRAGVELEFLDMSRIEYQQYHKYEFLENLSILDIILHCEKSKISRFLNDFNVRK